MLHITVVEGQLNATGLTFAIVASRFNSLFVDHLIDGAVDYLVRHGAERQNLTLVRIPGAFEIPLIANKLAASGKYDGIICLGAIIRGATQHFNYVAAEVSRGIACVALKTGIPVGFGVLTVDTLDQAIERSGSKAGNKGVEAAATVLETVQTLRQL
ncbi:6,7-dimethyl-8-ribityllumazine synthase [Desulfovibrionales bacterium]